MATFSSTFLALQAKDVEWALLYTDTGTGAKLDGSCWRPTAPEGYVSVGDCFIVGHEWPSESRPTMKVLFARNDPDVVRAIDLDAKHSEVWNDAGSGGKQDIRLIQPTAPAGFVSLGLVAY